LGEPEDRIGVERGWIGARFRVLVCTGTGSDKITSSGTRQQEPTSLVRSPFSIGAILRVRQVC
jgi:hypothetical protein